MAQLDAVQGVSSSSKAGAAADKVQGLSQEQILQDLRELLELLSGQKKSGGKKTEEKIIEAIIQNIQANLNNAHLDPKTTEKLEHLCKVTEANLDQIGNFAQQQQDGLFGDNTNEAYQLDLSGHPDLNTYHIDDHKIHDISKTNADNLTNNFDIQDYKEMLTRIHTEILVG